jgi:hypothetical protein
MLAAVLCFLGAGGYYLWRGGSVGVEVADPPPLVDVRGLTDTNRAVCGTPTADGSPVIVSMLYSQDKRAWVEDAAERFSHRCPNIQIKLTPTGDIEAADAILNGELDATLWAPADDLVLRYLDELWKERSGEVLFDLEDQLSLARSPLVVLAWEDRLRVLEAMPDSRRNGEGVWMEVLCALVPRDPGTTEIAIEDMVPGNWIDLYGERTPPPPPPIRRAGAATKKAAPRKAAYQQAFPTQEELKRWGRVKFVHTAPRRSASGLEALYLMAYDYALPPGERIAPEGDDTDRRSSAASGKEGGIRGGERFREAFEQAFNERKELMRRWLRRCEAGLESPPRSAALLTDAFFDVGSSRYDGVVTYEHLTFEILRQIDEHSKELRNVRVLYPQPTIVNQHPVVLLRPDDEARGDQLVAARKWIDFLRSKEMQLKAIEYGFRPSIQEVSIDTFDQDTNPFLHLRRYGVDFEQVIEEPPRLSGHVIHELIDIWEDATGRN